MTRSGIILSAIVLAGVTLFAGAFFLGSRVSFQQMSRPTDDLEWLRVEFKLSPDEIDRVRQVHDDYLPICEGYCSQIANEQRALKQLADAGKGGSEEGTNHLETIGHLRAQCQAAMLRHFEDVSELMPKEQGQRYLEEMRRITLGSHEQIEQSMSGSQGHVHDHH